MNNKIKIIRTSTISLSLNVLLKGQLKFLTSSLEVIAVSGYDDYLLELSSREGVRIVDVSMERQISPIKDLISLVKLIKLFRKEKPTIVHSITPKAGLLSMTAAYVTGVPIRIHTFTGLIFPSKRGLMKNLLIFMDKVLCKFASHIYPEGQGVLQDLLKYKVTSKPLKVIANGNINGIDLNHFNPEVISTRLLQELNEKLLIKEVDFVFIFVGRLVGDKGINELVNAFKRLSCIDSSVKLLLVGELESNLDPLHPSTINEIQSNRNIISVGFQKDVRPYYSISHALAFPSYREGFPNVVLQAGAMGLPSIVSNINGCNEIIIENVNGIIVPSMDENFLFLAMKKIKDDPKLRAKLKSNARVYIEARYEQSLVWDSILREYQNLLTNV